MAETANASSAGARDRSQSPKGGGFSEYPPTSMSKGTKARRRVSFRVPHEGGARVHSVLYLAPPSRGISVLEGRSSCIGAPADGHRRAPVGGAAGET